MIPSVFYRNRSLDELAVKCRTDKSHLVHNFAQFYDSHFKGLRNNSVKLLEIGVGRGASIRMWNKYFKKVEMVAVESERRRRHYWMLGAKLYVGRQEDRGFLATVCRENGPFDIIIDDGSHRVDDQQISLGALFPFLKEGGYYVIEDIHTSFPDPVIDFGLVKDGSNSTYQMLLDFKKGGKLRSGYMTPEEKRYLETHISLCDVYAYQDETKHLTSILRKSAKN